MKVVGLTQGAHKHRGRPRFCWTKKKPDNYARLKQFRSIPAGCYLFVVSWILKCEGQTRNTIRAGVTVAVVERSLGFHDVLFGLVWLCS
ncbi:hypothetical protein DENSPDRAFT_596314 [Dentipellis sp. KUC8613]|nr:hypothetical protein DENSPDRAFT_596314 [Dentipellis sp. KUC8613]